MPIIKWDDKYRTGNKLVDHQHEELFRMINTLHDEIMEGRCANQEMLATTLKELAWHSAEHFLTEEGLMEATNYPEMDAHKKKHEELAGKIKDMVKSYETGKVVLTVVVPSFLIKWLKGHFEEHDIPLISYLSALKEESTTAGR